MTITATRALAIAGAFTAIVMSEPTTAIAQTSNGLPNQRQQAAAKRAITQATLRGHVEFLADDLLEGRGPGSRGDRLAQKYIVAQFRTLGLQPAAAKGNWLQPVPLIGVTSRPPRSIEFRRSGGSLKLSNHQDYIVVCGNAERQVTFDGAEVVFVGYGMQAPEYDWDDFKDVDVRGKVLLVMNNDPAADPELFAGKTRLYYGRWDYKYAKAAERGAVGALIIHTTASAGYPFQVVQTSWTGEQMALGGKQTGRLPIEGWLTESAASKLVEFAGQNLAELRRMAERRDFRPVPLATTVSLSMESRVRKRETANVLGLLKGSDPNMAREWVVYTAHHDHIGMAGEAPDPRRDNIYNGAVDNASGVAAMLSIAQAMSRLPAAERPRRSVLFAAVGAEEQGLLGSKYLARNPPTPAGNLAAVLNIDGINILGPTRDVVVIGRGKSDMDDVVTRLARWQNRVVVGDQFPDRGYYYRSDQFSLAQIGVPGVYLGRGVHVVGKPDGWGRQKLREWTENIYHQASDEYDPNWDLRGAVQDTRLLFYAGLQTANRQKLPAWSAGDEFEAARLRALESRPQ